uniref:Transcription elongation regulator 1 like n=1 Tax=Rousettus aegyptiacus TaxID=9407 RepID=A0A7J8GIC2_ROUAE|nr:transcription elongation regulator 1 like [Rousettus aegyptiacus]
MKRCVVWTGDDRVFFFNPTTQLSVWEKPEDLERRGDLGRIIDDPPHKRKLAASAADHSDVSSSEDGREDPNVKTKRNRARHSVLLPGTCRQQRPVRRQGQAGQKVILRQGPGRAGVQGLCLQADAVSPHRAVLLVP